MDDGFSAKLAFRGKVSCFSIESYNEKLIWSKEKTRITTTMKAQLNKADNHNKVMGN